MSFWQRVTTDASNALADVYAHWVLGDDAGKCAHLALLHRPSSSSNAALGLTFLEINGRAYVKSVAAGSRADRAGVQPQDAVQLAVAVRPEWVRGGGGDDHNVTATAVHGDDGENNKNEQGSFVGANDNNSGSSSSNRNRLAVQYALNLERKGARISYDQLLRLVSEAVLGDDPVAIQKHFVSPPVNAAKAVSAGKGGADGESAWNGPPIPSTICAPIILSEDASSSPAAAGGGGLLSDSHSASSGDYGGNSQQQPVVFVFRRTRQRHSIEAAGLLPTAFRLDDECDLACSLVRRLAPTADMEAPTPDTWEELVHDGTDWLLGTGSMLPPKGQEVTVGGGVLMNNSSNNNHHNHGGGGSVSEGGAQQQQQHALDESSIPYDDFERVRAQKLATLRSRMTAEAMQVDRTEDVEAATIRGMIQKAVGLAFVRSSKVVLGVSIHGGSGIVISRLSDGTWSAPSAIGTWGLGLGLQFGLEMAEYIFILQTEEALEHFRSGGSYTVGGNMGVAVAGLGREAYGAASVGGGCGSSSTVLHDDEYNDENDDSREERRHRAPQSLAIAPIVAYAKSQGLYIGVSLEGSRIFTRDDINSRAYKFGSGKTVTANDILSGKVPTPPEAEELYAALHSVEFTHEMSCLPRPPEVLRKDSANAWNYERSPLADRAHHARSMSDSSNRRDPFSFFSRISKEERRECETFEAQFKNFMYGGVSVQRLLTDTEGRSARTGKERRTLWLMLPEVGSLRLGFVSKLSDGEGAVSNKNSTLRARRDDPSRMSSAYDANDLGTVGSEDLTLDSAFQTKDGSTIGPIRSGNVQLSDKHSVALTDVTVLSQEPLVPVQLRGEDKTQHLRVISLQDVSGTSLLFLANNFREAELLICGLKLLLERETARLGVRGGLPITALGGKNKDGAMSPAAARGFRDSPNRSLPSSSTKHRQRGTRNQKQSSGYDSSVGGDESLLSGIDENDSKVAASSPAEEPKKWSKWSKQPGRDYMRGQASSLIATDQSGMSEQGVPQYVHGQQIVRAVAQNILLPLPLPLCRVLLLDSTSPVIKQWEKDRRDTNFDRTTWTFPPATPRELERHSSEHQLIASGSMAGASRKSSFDRPRYGSIVRLSETHTVEADNPKKVSYTVTERNPRRGFSLKVRIVLRAQKEKSCEASIFAEVRPVGKDMSNQAAVHKAFQLVLEEINERYGVEGNGLLSGFLSVVDDIAERNSKTEDGQPPSLARPFHRTDPNIKEEKKTDRNQKSVPRNNSSSGNESGLVSFEDMLKTGRESPETMAVARPETPSLNAKVPEPDPSKRTPAKAAALPEVDEFVALDEVNADKKKDPVLIEVKPLPKIRLSLMPSPREEDEEEGSRDSPVPSKPIKKKKKKSSRSRKSIDNLAPA